MKVFIIFFIARSIFLFKSRIFAFVALVFFWSEVMKFPKSIFIFKNWMTFCNNQNTRHTRPFFKYLKFFFFCPVCHEFCFFANSHLCKNPFKSSWNSIKYNDKSINNNNNNNNNSNFIFYSILSCDDNLILSDKEYKKIRRSWKFIKSTSSQSAIKMAFLLPLFFLGIIAELLIII